MAQLSVIFLILLHSFMIFSVTGESSVAHSSSSSSTSKIQNWPQAPSTRKLGKHSLEPAKFYADVPHLSPSESPQGKEKHSPSNQEVSQSPQSAPREKIHMNKGHNNNGSGNNSAAGGEVILGGLATTFLVAIFCYIRATRRNNATLSPLK